MVGCEASTARALSTDTAEPNVACTAIACVVITGTRTQVADTFSSGMPRILRDSLRTLSSSDDQPSSFTEPAHGTTLNASGAGNGEADAGPTGRPASVSAAATSPARWPTSLPDSAAISA